MDSKRLRQIISRGEGTHTEFKHSAPRPDRLASDLAAFANGQGGRIVFGIDQSNKVVGARPHRVARRLSEALSLIEPRPRVETETVSLDGREVVVISIPPGPLSPYLASGRLYQRSGNRIAGLKGQFLFANIAARSNSPAELVIEVQRLSGVVERLNADVASSRGWKPRTLDFLLGGLIGAGISLALTSLLSLI